MSNKMNSENSENPAKRSKMECKSEAETKETRVDDEYIACHTGQIIESYRIEKQIGEGKFGRVVEASNVISGDKVALKFIKNNWKNRNVAMAEIVALKTIRARDPDDESLCIKMLDWFNNDTYFCIVFPMMGQSVFDFIQDNDEEPFPMDQIIHISYQLCHAVYFLHRNGITHTDLKPENMLFVNSSYTTIYDPHGKCNIKRINCTDIRLADFGLATRDKDKHRPVVSTRYYRAPEVILRLGWSQPCDVWSIGCILVEIYCGDLLFDVDDDGQHLAMMETTLGPIPTTMANSTKTKLFSNGKKDWSREGDSMPLEEYMECNLDNDVQLFDLIRQMLTYEPKERILLSEALTHKFFHNLPTHQQVINTNTS